MNGLHGRTVRTKRLSGKQSKLFAIQSQAGGARYTAVPTFGFIAMVYLRAQVCHLPLWAATRGWLQCAASLPMGGACALGRWGAFGKSVDATKARDRTNPVSKSSKFSTKVREIFKRYKVFLVLSFL